MKRAFGKFQLKAPRAYKCKQILGLCQTDKNTVRENNACIDWDYQPGDKVLLQKDGILHNAESQYESYPWTITSVHTNGTIRVQHGSKSER